MDDAKEEHLLDTVAPSSHESELSNQPQATRFVSPHRDRNASAGQEMKPDQPHYKLAQKYKLGTNLYRHIPAVFFTSMWSYVVHFINAFD